MKKILLSLLCLVGGLSLSAQKTKKVPYPGGHYSIYRLWLQDKKGTDFTLRHPEKFLSEKALRRRYKQNLQVDSTDLPISQRYLERIEKVGLHVIGGSKWNNTALVKVTDKKTLENISQLSFVKIADKVFEAPDSIVPEQRETIVVDSTAKFMVKTNSYGLGKHQIEMLNGLKLHEAGFRGDGMTIAIIDGGFQNVDKIPYFKNVNIIGQRDFVYPYNADVYGLGDHGTMVLSDIGANVDSMFIGTAPHASFVLLRSEDGPTEYLVEEDWWVQAVEYADSIGADVISSSLGYFKFDDKSMNHQYREQNGNTAINSRTASRIASKGMILVNSAGNEGGRTWKRTNFPADARDILCVAALTADSVNATFSSVGPSYDGRVKPDIGAQGVNSTVIDGTGIITTANGTSFAAPISAGMVTCLWQALPERSAYEIMDLVRKSGSRADFPDNIYGYGVPNYWKAYQTGNKK